MRPVAAITVANCCDFGALLCGWCYKVFVYYLSISAIEYSYPIFDRIPAQYSATNFMLVASIAESARKA